MDAVRNFAYSTVATAPSPATSGTSLVVASGDGAKFPPAPFNLTVWPAGATPTTANAEIVRVTAVSTDTLTIIRTQESTTARTIVAGDQVAQTATARLINDAFAVGAHIPGEHNALGWTIDPMFASTASALATGRTFVYRAKVTSTSAISNVSIQITSAGTSVTSGYIGLYSLDGQTQYAVSANQTTAWQSTGAKTVAMTAATPVLPINTDILVAYLAVGSPVPSVSLSVSAAAMNLLTTTSTPSRALVLAATGMTTLPSTLTLGTASAQTQIIAALFS